MTPIGWDRIGEVAAVDGVAVEVAVDGDRRIVVRIGGRHSATLSEDEVCRLMDVLHAALIRAHLAGVQGLSRAEQSAVAAWVMQVARRPSIVHATHAAQAHLDRLGAQASADDG